MSTSGGAKTNIYRALLYFDLAAAPASGAARSSSQITRADLNIVASSGGVSPFNLAITAERVTRSDWAGYPDTTYTNYKAGTPWTTLGGDVDVPSVALVGPPGPGPYSMGDLKALVIDAINNRAGKLHLRLKATNEAPANDGYIQTFAATLAVTYSGGQDTDERDPGVLLGVRPAFIAAPRGRRRRTPGKELSKHDSRQMTTIDRLIAEMSSEETTQDGVMMAAYILGYFSDQLNKQNRKPKRRRGE